MSLVAEMDSCQVLDLSVRHRVPTGPSTPYDTWQYSPASSSEPEPGSPDPRPPALKAKSCRPFKAYAKDPLGLTQGFVDPEVLQRNSDEAFLAFRSKILSQVQVATNGTNKNMRRVANSNGKSDDPTYWEKRRKNNEAAKRSRDARRAKEDEMAIRCAFLEQENFQLKASLEATQREMDRIRRLLCYPKYE